MHKAWKDPLQLISTGLGTKYEEYLNTSVKMQQNTFQMQINKSLKS